MKKNMITVISAMLAITSCTPLTLIDGTMLDNFIDEPAPSEETKIEEIIVDGEDWEIHYSIDGYRLENVEIIGIKEDKSRIDITDSVSIVSTGNESVTISYGGCTAELPIKHGESISIYIDPETIYYDFYMPNEFPGVNSVFVGWANAGNDELLPFPIVNYSHDEAIAIHPVYKDRNEVFTMNGNTITGTKGTLYEFYGIPSVITGIEAGAFKNNKTVKAIAFENNASITAINADTFYFSGIEYIEIPASVTAIGDRAFDGAVNLKEVIFEEGSALEIIGRDAFSVLNMTEFTVPKSVKTIERSAFGMDVYLEKIVFEKGTEIESISQFAFDNDFSLRTIEFIDPVSPTIPDGADSGWGAPLSPVIIWDGNVI